ncbi:hypothetical protein [Saccharopolyspora gloriosae]|uniref:hypothetical protein n=1 Tax=Saccharopolyspora gloriosae TaxID=455344 RepID=UPI001FB64724|nr:hypothetical protein [Saccharopolyspora gloriosae]
MEQERSGGRTVAAFPVRVRYRAGAVGEAKRVVHVAMPLRDGDYLALCEERLTVADAEVISDLLGMPCMACTRVMALRSRVTACEAIAPELEAG